jgi:hypothetical protein
LQPTEAVRRHPRIFNTAFESGIRSLVLLTACYPQRLGLHKLVVLDHLVVHTGDLGGPPSLHPSEDSRAAEMLVRRGLVDSGLSLMGTRGLIKRHAVDSGFRYEAGDEAGSFVDHLHSHYAIELKMRASWLAEHVVPMSDDDILRLVRERMDRWAAEFQSGQGRAG